MKHPSNEYRSHGNAIVSRDWCRERLWSTYLLVGVFPILVAGACSRESQQTDIQKTSEVVHGEDEANGQLGGNQTAENSTDVPIAIRREVARLGRLLASRVEVFDHWVHFESKENRVLVDKLVSTFDTGEYQWRVIRNSKNDKKGEYKPANEFEEQLLEEWNEGVKRERSNEEMAALEAKARTRLQLDPAEEAITGNRPKSSVSETEYIPNPKFPAYREIRKDDEYVYYQPVFIREAFCVNCHRQMNTNPELKEGDLQAIVQIRFPVDTFPSTPE